MPGPHYLSAEAPATQEAARPRTSQGQIPGKESGDASDAGDAWFSIVNPHSRPCPFFEDPSTSSPRVQVGDSCVTSVTTVKCD